MFLVLYLPTGLLAISIFIVNKAYFLILRQDDFHLSFWGLGINLSDRASSEVSPSGKVSNDKREGSRTAWHLVSNLFFSHFHTCWMKFSGLIHYMAHSDFRLEQKKVGVNNGWQ